MPQRTPGEEDPAQGSARGTRSQKAAFRFPLGMARTQQMGNRGLAAASIGWTLAGCILVGFFAGSWLDRKFGTQYWTLILLLVGVFAGFREMFRTLAQIGQAPERQESGQATGLPTGTEVTRPASAQKNSGQAPQVLEAPERQRIFSVPPPPFMDQPPGAVRSGPSAEEVKRLLLGDLPGEEERDAV